MSTTPADDVRAPAVARAEQATEGWAVVARLQRWDTSAHANFYALAGELAGTLHAVEDLTRVLTEQVARYGAARTLYDDTYAFDPTVRLPDACSRLDGALHAIGIAACRISEFWSTIGPIGGEVPT